MSEKFICEICGSKHDSQRGLSIHQSYGHDKPWKDAETLFKLHHEKGMSQQEMAEYFGINQKTLQHWIDKLDVDFRDRSDARLNYIRQNPVWFGTNSSGYEVWSGKYQNQHYDYYVHRLLAIAEYGVEKAIGNTVHHKNKIPWDNRPENIELMSNQEHVKQHWEDGDYE